MEGIISIKNETKRLDYIDSIRGISCILVYIVKF